MVHETLKVEIIQTGSRHIKSIVDFKKLLSNGSGYNNRVQGFGKSKEDVMEF